MKHEDLLRVCLQNLLRRKSRTILTVLGVLIGCCSIVIMVSLGIGMKESQEKLLAEMGDLTIITVTAPQKGKGKKKLDDSLLKTIREMDGVEGVTPKLSFDNYTCRLLFLEASVDTIVMRYKETRRPHPLRDAYDSLEAAVRHEAALMRPVREEADFVIL